MPNPKTDKTAKTPETVEGTPQAAPQVYTVLIGGRDVSILASSPEELQAKIEALKLL